MKKQLSIFLLLLSGLLLFAALPGYACGKMKQAKSAVVENCKESARSPHHCTGNCSDHTCNCLAGCHTSIKGTVTGWLFQPLLLTPLHMRWYYPERAPSKVFLPTFVPPKIGSNTAV